MEFRRIDKNTLYFLLGLLPYPIRTHTIETRYCQENPIVYVAPLEQVILIYVVGICGNPPFPEMPRHWRKCLEFPQLPTQFENL